MAFAVVPFVLVVALVLASIHHGTFAYDFHGGLYNAARDIIHGRSPYRAGYLAQEAALKRDGVTPPYIDVPVYPPLAFLAVIPLALLPFKVAGLLFTAVTIGALILALSLLEVRDWRCYGLAFASWPVLDSVLLGGLTPLLALGAAAGWRYRERTVPAALAIASVIAAKLFPWTIAVWLLVTKRLTALAFVVGFIFAGILGAWALIGFHGITSYPAMLSNLSYIQQSLGVSAIAAGTSLGGSVGVADVAMAAATVSVLALAWRLALTPGCEDRAFGLVVIAALVACTSVWPHYLTFAFIPIALLSRRLSPIWFVPLLADLAPTNQTHGDFGLVLPYLLIEAVVVVSLCRSAGLARGAPSSPAQARSYL